MRTLKPTAVTALNAPFQHGGRVRLVFVVGVMSSLDGNLVEQEQTVWKSVASLPGSVGMLDEMKPKVRGEALLSGFAFAPKGQPAPVVAARMQVGTLAKEVWAIGDQFWKLTGPTEPVPFERMPLSYDRAFGGEGFDDNPGGKGYALIKAETGPSVQPLPNLELPSKRVTSPGDRPPVAGFAPVDPSVPRRMKKLGTYDRKWLRTRYPEMADDFDPTYFNVAPDDQWIEGYWEGGEPFVLQNVHKDHPKIEGTVPRFRARAFVTRRGAAEGGLEEVLLRCDTLWFLPNDERVILLFRGGIDTIDDEGSDLLDVLVGLERPDAPKPLDHYRDVRSKRTSKGRAALHFLRDKDLLPADVRVAKSSALTDMDCLHAREGLLEANQRARAAAELERARERYREHGVDPDAHGLPKDLPPPMTLPEPDELADFVEEQVTEADKARRDAEERREKALSDLRARGKQLGIDIDKKLAEGRVGGPPKVNADARLAELRRAAAQSRASESLKKADDPAFVESLRKAEAAALDAYRRAAYYMPPAAVLEEDAARAMRLQIETVLIADHSLADRDLTGADLSGLDFSGRDLSGTLLERANLAGCSFKGANVSRVVFTRADLKGADFDGANATRANFGGADLTRARMRQATLKEAVLTGANLADADLTDALLHRTQVMELRAERAVMANVHADGLTLMKADLRGADLRGARFERSTLLNADLNGADLRGARMFRTSVMDTTIEDAQLDGITLERVSFTKAEKGTSLARSSFRGASLRRINFRGVDLRGADFRECDLSDADLSKADLSDAKLTAARAPRSRFVGTNLRGADLSRTDLQAARMGGADVSGATFEEANLFRADADRMRGDDKTSFQGANLKQVRVTPATGARPRTSEQS